jgi:uroporphyrinogen-III decarboxylase
MSAVLGQRKRKNFNFSRFPFLKISRKAYWEEGLVYIRFSSKERLLKAINHEEPDHVPLYIKWWERQFPESPQQTWRNQYERIEWNLKHGLDQGVELPDLRWTQWLNPEVKIKTWKENVPGEKYPILYKEYETPKGTLRQVIRQTKGWNNRSKYNYFDVGDDIPLTGNILVNRSLKFLVETVEEIEAFDCLFRGINEEEREAFFQEAERAKKYAEEHDLLLEGGAFSIIGGDSLPWFCGIEKTMINTYRRPELVQNILKIVHKHDMEVLQLIAEAGPDVVFHEGWYENGQFWSPQAFKKFLAPLIREEVELAHHHGIKYCQIITTGLTSLLKILKELNVDILFGLDPVQGMVNLWNAKEEVGDKICLWGGVNAAVTLGFGTKENIMKETIEAINALAPGGGFILAPIDQLWPYTPWENITYMIDAWRGRASYTRV